MFGNKSEPSIVYKFGSKAPHENFELVEEQLRLAHNYKNALVECELDRRKRVEELLLELFPDFVATEKDIAVCEAELEEAVTVVNQYKSRELTQKVPKDLRAVVTKRRARLAELRKKRKELRAQLFASQEFQDRQVAISADDLVERKRLRANSGLYWGTYLDVERAAAAFRKGRPPKFRRWEGSGKLAVEIQGGMPAGWNNTSTLVRMERDAERSTERKDRAIVSLRAGSNKRKPVWVRVKATIHRMFPVGSEIKWVYLVRRRVACSYEWSVQFQISRSTGFKKPSPGRGRIGIDVGWRWRFVDGLRVAYWADERGNHGEFSLPGNEITRWTKANDLQAIRDKRFNVARDELRDWLNDHEVPEWLTERTKTLRQWRSQARLAGLVIGWRSQRFPEDSEIFQSIESWRKKDRHLYEWEEHQRRKAIRWRDNHYYNFVLWLRENYDEIVLEKANWKDVKRIALPEDEDQPWSRTYGGMASVGRLREIIIQSGLRVVLAPAHLTTQKCYACGKRMDFDAANELVSECPQCFSKEDQDHNAALNLLAYNASGQVVAQIS